MYLPDDHLPAAFFCCQQLLKGSDINRDKDVSLHEALKCTTSVGQGFGKCNCAALEKKCSNLKMFQFSKLS